MFVYTIINNRGVVITPLSLILEKCTYGNLGDRMKLPDWQMVSTLEVNGGIYVFIYTYLQIYMNMHICSYIYMYIYLNILTCIHMHIYVFMYVYKRRYTYTLQLIPIHIHRLVPSCF
jgi:hypothetical protein